MKSLKDMTLSHFNIVGEAESFDWEHKKVARVPSCRIMPEYRDAFKHEDYEVIEAPKEIMELFHKVAAKNNLHN